MVENQFLKEENLKLREFQTKRSDESEKCYQ